jgi:two-component system, NarL family, nitrate/nitrite response regulator NarL
MVIVDDHPLLREGVAHTLRAEPDIEVVGEGETADDAIRLARDLLPDVILLDITMPGGGVNAARSIAATCPVTKIVMLTVSEEEEDVLAAFKAGAQAYILKGVAARELVSILRAVYVGEVWVTPKLAASLLMDSTRAVSKAEAANEPLSALTEREHEILTLVAEGLSNREIGQQLFLTEKTIKHYMTNILQKLHVRNRLEAALLVQKSERA